MGRPPKKKTKSKASRKPGRPRSRARVEMDAIIERAEDEIASAPPPPAMPGEEPQMASAALLALGPPPTDDLEAANWAYRAQLAAIADAIADPRITAAARRKEIRMSGAAAATLFPKAEEYKIRQEIREDRARLEERAKQKGGAKLETRVRTPTNTNAPASPIAVAEDFGDAAG